MANMGRMGGVKKARGLLTKDGLIEMTVKKGILDIELMDRPGLHGGEAQNEADGGGLHHRTEGLGIINPVLLGETANDPTGLVPCKRAIGVEFVAEDPLASHHINTCRTSN
jgi:hypothetical protein